LRFVAGEIGHDHRDLEHLFLKQWDAEGASEHRLKARIEIGDRLFPGAPRQAGMNHVTLDRSWPNDRHFDDDVVKTFWFHPWQRRDLGAALDLKYADGVGVLHDLECLLVILRNVGKIEWAAALATKLERVLHYRHHPQA